MIQLILSYWCKDTNHSQIFNYNNQVQNLRACKLNWTLLTRLRNLPAHPREAHSHREGRYLLSLVLPECGQFQRGAGGASSHEEGVWECGCGPTGTNLSPIQRSAGANWLTRQNKGGSREKRWTLLSLLVKRAKHDSQFESVCLCLHMNIGG